MLVRCALLLLAARALPPCDEDVALDPPCPERAPAPPATTLRLAINVDAPMVTEHDGAAFATVFVVFNGTGLLFGLGDDDFTKDH